MRRVLGVGVAAAALAALAAVGPWGAGPAVAGRVGGAAPQTPIRHLVVMTQDQHTFDNYFGTRRGVDGIPPGTCLPVASGGPCAVPRPMAPDSSDIALRTGAGSQAIAVDGGLMDGFARAQTAPHSDGSDALRYYRPAELPVLTALADHGVLFDRWFSGVPGGSVANRLFDVTATARPGVGEVPGAGWGTLPTIFDRLDAAGVSWRVYVENYEPALTIGTASTKARLGGQIVRLPLLAMSRFVHDPALAAHIVDLSQYYRDASAGRLPAVSWIVTTSSTEHLARDVARGQQLVRTVVNSLVGGPDWPSSAFLLQYDSWGGWYDHVPPATLAGEQTGLRVPALLLSPYATPDTVDPTTFDAAAPLAFIERNWGLAPLTARDRDSADLTGAFDFTRTPTGRPALIGVAGGAPVHQPRRGLLVAGYVSALTGAIAVVGWTSVRDRRRLRRWRAP